MNTINSKGALLWTRKAQPKFSSSSHSDSILILICGMNTENITHAMAISANWNRLFYEKYPTKVNVADKQTCWMPVLAGLFYETFSSFRLLANSCSCGSMTPLLLKTRLIWIKSAFLCTIDCPGRSDSHVVFALEGLSRSHLCAIQIS